MFCAETLVTKRKSYTAQTLSILATEGDISGPFLGLFVPISLVLQIHTPE